MNNMTDFEDICRKINEEEYCAFIITGKDITDLPEQLKLLGITECENSSVCISIKGQKVPWLSFTDTVTYQQIYLLFHDDLVYSDRNRLADEYTADSKSVKVVIYDKVTDDICDVFTVAEANPEVVCR